MNIQNPEDIVESPELDAEDAVPAPYWTPERMATAEPLPFSIPAGRVKDTPLLTSPHGDPIVGESRTPNRGESHKKQKSSDTRRTRHLFEYS